MPEASHDPRTSEGSGERPGPEPRHEAPHPWGAKDHGFRPPWWPEGEPFPPRGGPPWAGMRRYFIRRAVAALFLVFLFVFAIGALTREVVSRATGGHAGPPALLVALLVIVALVLGGRWLRRTVAPLGDVMEAADRVAAGDLSARVEPRGPWDVRRLGRSFNQMAERLESDEARRRELLADVAHELRTPLQVLRGTVEGMLDGLYPTDPEHLAPILAETTVMARLLDDLMTLSTAEAGALELHPEPSSPSVLVSDAVVSFRSTAEAAGVALREHAEDGVPDLEIDPVRIGEVLANLVANAIRHTPRGGEVELSVRSADGGAVEFAVRDTGRGIDADRLPHVFKRFERAADSGGSGLGLAIAKSLVEAHGGTITAESEPDAGTTITFTLPASRR